MALVSWVELIASRLESAKKPLRDEVDVCSCPRPNGLLTYEFKTEAYTGRGSCETDKVCAILMIAKHRALLSDRKSKRRALRKATLDEFF